MLSAIINFVLGLQNIACYLFLISYRIGKCLIYLLDLLWNHTFAVLRTGLAVVKVVCEDFALFTMDALEEIYYAITLLGSGIDSLFSFIGSIDSYAGLLYDSIFTTITSSYLNLAGFVNKLVACCTHSVNAVKYMFVLFGSGVWFAVTLLPMSVFYTLVFCVYYTRVVFDGLIYAGYVIFLETCNFFVNVKQFFTDVPFEATLGLLFTCCITYVISKCYIMLFKYAKHKTRTFGRYLSVKYEEKKKIFTEKKVVVVKKIKIEGDDSSYCVICHERQKSVLILPCKHVCICDECQNTMRRYQRKCPVCRTNIERTMKVFV